MMRFPRFHWCAGLLLALAVQTTAVAAPNPLPPPTAPTSATLAASPAFPRNAQAPAGNWHPDPDYQRRFSHPGSLVRLQIHQARQAGNLRPVDLLEEHRRVLENSVTLPPAPAPTAETAYNPGGGTPTIDLPKPKGGDGF